MHWLCLFGEPDEIIPEADGSLGTYIGALRAGYVSVTRQSFAVELSHLSPGFQSFIVRLTDMFPLAAMGKGASRNCEVFMLIAGRRSIWSRVVANREAGPIDLGTANQARLAVRWRPL